MSAWKDLSVAAEDERERLILEHVPLLKHIVGRMSCELPRTIDRDDLYGFGMLGLVAAADAWDASRGLKFSTFAYPKIRGAILDELRRSDFLPRGRREKVRDLERFCTRIEKESGLPPSPEEISDQLGLSPAEVDEILLSARSAHEVSLQEGPSESLGALLSDPRSDDPLGSAEWEESKQTLAAAIGELSDQEQTVITLYYAEDLLLKEIAEVLGVTESRVSQIHTRALFRLNRSLSEQLESTGG